MSEHGDGHTTAKQRYIAYQFKAEFGEMAYNKANRTIASEWVRNYMRAHDWRTVDIVQQFPMVVELCLTPTVAVETASKFASDLLVRGRRRHAQVM